MSKVSIIIPVYNVEKYVGRCLESVMSQENIDDLEIIVIDDGSTDNSGRICDDFAKKNLKFRVIHKSNQGISNARNLGLEIAKGEYIMFLDSDDYLEKGIVKNLLDEAIQKNADIVGGAWLNMMRLESI